LTDLNFGVARYRVFTVGAHRFFEWQEPLPNPGTSFFPGMRTGPHLRDAMSDIARILQEAPGTVFFGPRLEFAYAVFGMPSPKDLPIWWDPGTAFAHEDEPALIEVWRQKHFKTLIFLGDDFTYYPYLITRVIDSNYTPELRPGGILVFHRK
jgi:hypothetical protein